MNRPLNSATALLMVMLVGLPARAQAPLVVGVVRDQRGAAIQGARVEGREALGPLVGGTTDAEGTFALTGAGISSIAVSCRYCRSATAAVTPGQPVVVIVHRYEALTGTTPTTADLENLPYAHVESALALRPFTLLSQSMDPYPGPTLSDRGLSPAGSLLVDDGAANYDVVTGTSPYGLVPAQFERSASLGTAADAYLYGDQAAGGIATATPFGGDTNWEVASLGSDATARAQVGSQDLNAVLGSFSNNEESRQRGDLFAFVPLGGAQSLSLGAGSDQGRTFAPASAGMPFDASFAFADATYVDPQLANLYVTATLDRGDYTWGDYDYSSAAAWSDSQFGLGVRSSGTLQAFADLGLRASTGLYQQSLAWSPLPGIGATLDQTRIDAGLTARTSVYDVTAGVGAFWIDYGGGSYGVSQPVKTALAVPSLQATLFPDARWSLNVEGSGSFTLPTFVQQYSYAGGLPTSLEYQRNELLSGTLTYTDQSRLRFSFEEATERVTGSSPGTITSAGFSAVWQVAPALSLRAWTMHVTDTVAPYGVSGEYFEESTPTVNAMWLTYDANGGVRVDAIYRRDLLDSEPFYHIDGDVSGPIAGGVRWYAGAEDRLRRTFVDAGLRLGAQ